MQLKIQSDVGMKNIQA